MAKFYNEEDLHSIFLDAFDIGRKSVDEQLDTSNLSEFAWERYKSGNQFLRNKPEPSRPIVDKPPDELLCPKCNGPMISRSSKYGQFWGCSKYPKCNGTRDSEGLTREERDAKREVQESVQQHKGFSFTKRQ